MIRKPNLITTEILLTCGNPGCATCSIAIRDGSGKWIISCIKELEVCSNFVVENIGLRHGLLMAQNRGLLLVQIEIDAIFSFQAFSHSHLTHSIYVYSPLEDCKALMILLENPPIKHIYIEANGVTNWMAKNDVAFCDSLLVFLSTP